MIEQIATGCSIIITAISIITAITKSLKTNKNEKTVKLAKIVQTIPETINEAEELLGSGNGKAKLSYVLNKLNIKCLQVGIEFDENGLTEEVEKILETPQKK